MDREAWKAIVMASQRAENYEATEHACTLVLLSIIALH